VKNRIQEMVDTQVAEYEQSVLKSDALAAAAMQSVIDNGLEYKEKEEVDRVFASIHQCDECNSFDTTQSLIEPQMSKDSRFVCNACGYKWDHILD